MTEPKPSDPCPCHSGKVYGDCCGPILGGAQKAPTAEALMRARYTAYAIDDVDFLFASSGDAVRAEFDPAGAHKWARNSVWTGMEVLDVQRGGIDDDEGSVEFVAHYTVKRQPFSHHERSLFKRVEGEWRFIDGELITPENQKGRPQGRPQRPLPLRLRQEIQTLLRPLSGKLGSLEAWRARRATKSLRPKKGTAPRRPFFCPQPFRKSRRGGWTAGTVPAGSPAPFASSRKSAPPPPDRP